MLRIVSLGLVVVAFHTVAADDADADRKLSQALQGDWQVVKAEKDGEVMPKEKVAATWFQFKGDQLTIFEPNQKDGEKAKFRLDESKSPVHLDVIVKGEDKALMGIVKLEGTRLTLCVGLEQQERPRTFEPAKGRIYAELQAKK